MNNTIKIGKRTYKIISVEFTEELYPNFFKHGVTEFYTLKFGKTIFTANGRNGVVGNVMRAYGN